MKSSIHVSKGGNSIRFKGRAANEAFKAMGSAPIIASSAESELRQWLGVLLDQCDYTNGACSATEMVGAVISADVLANARKALKL